MCYLVCCYLGAVQETFPCVSNDSLDRKASNPYSVWKGRKGMLPTNSLCGESESVRLK